MSTLLHRVLPAALTLALAPLAHAQEAVTPKLSYTG